jgi:DNA modification methylase
MLADCLETEAMRSGSASIQLGDSRGIMPNENFDLCVTSPPYLNSFDYTDVYRPELFLSGFVKTMEELTTLRTMTLRSHVQTKWSSPLASDFGQHYDETMSRLDAERDHLWNRRIPEMVQAYFEDMSSVFLNLRSKAKQSASVWLVVSTSAYGGVEIPVDLILADIAGRNGWFLREVTVLRYLRRVSGQQWHKLNNASDGEGPYLRESLIILDAKPRLKGKAKRG